MMVDGKRIAADILAEVARDTAALGRVPTLAAITCAPNFETKKYLEMKKRRAAAVGILLRVIELPSDSTTDQVVECVTEVALQSDSVVVQLPLPLQIDRAAVLQAVPRTQDPDGFQYDGTNSTCLPPVIGAIDEIAQRHHIGWSAAQTVILGQGKLVGQPAAIYARVQGAHVTVMQKDDFDEAILRTADIVITGIGQPHFVTPAMVKPGVVIFDAGTSEDGGVLAGDVHGDVAHEAALFTPVPGGIGPITIAYLLRNCLDLISNPRQ